MIADGKFLFALSEGPDDAHFARAGLFGYRALRMAGDAKRLGLYGFGAAAHIIAQVAKHQGREIFAFTQSGDDTTQRFARELGAVWAGGSDAMPPERLDAALIFAPVGALVPAALRATIKGGVVVCAGIHMSDIPGFPYDILWEERVIRSVANLTRRDAEEFFAVAPKVPVKTQTTRYALSQANDALDDLRHGRFDGAAVLVPDAANAKIGP
jgi:propanol-preferring alcohol dehydrogenase